MKLSVIVPSRLQPNPASHTGNLYLDRALSSIQRCEVTGVELEIIVALDERKGPWRIGKWGMARGLPARFHGGSVRTVASGARSQAAAVNAGVKASTGDCIAFLEDDDQWYPDKLRYQLPLLDRHGFVSCNQREIDEQANFVRLNNFATPSGWLMHREVWDKVGPMDTTFQYHVDTEWLGRLNRSVYKRAHLVSIGAEKEPRGWLQQIAQYSAIVQSEDVTEPLVARTVNPGGGMERIRTDPEAAAQSMREHEIMMERFGSVPW